MKNKELNDKQIEQLVDEVIPNVIKQHDDEMVSQLGKMSHEQLDELLGRKKQTTTETPTTSETSAAPRRARIITFARLAAGCAVLVLILVGIDHLNLGTITPQKNAQLFKNNFNEYKWNGQTFSAGGNTKNSRGEANTAYIIQEASKLIGETNSRKNLNKGISYLERMITKRNFKPELEHEIHWYLGLAYLKDNRISEARDEFQKVIYLKSPHTNDAKKLLKQIK